MLVICHFEQRQQNIAANFGCARTPGHTKAIAAAGNFNIQAALNLAQVFIKLSAQVSKAEVIGGLENDVPRNLDSTQNLYL